MVFQIITVLVTSALFPWQHLRMNSLKNNAVMLIEIINMVMLTCVKNRGEP